MTRRVLQNWAVNNNMWHSSSSWPKFVRYECPLNHWHMSWISSKYCLVDSLIQLAKFGETWNISASKQTNCSSCRTSPRPPWGPASCTRQPHVACQCGKMQNCFWQNTMLAHMCYKWTNWHRAEDVQSQNHSGTGTRKMFTKTEQNSLLSETLQRARLCGQFELSLFWF